jgi:hypothetical protein
LSPSLLKSGGQKGGQALLQRVDEPMGQVLHSRTELKRRKKLGEGIDGQPEPEHLCGAAQPGAQLAQLEMREVEVTEEALMEELSMLACTGEPPRNSGLSKAENSLGGGSIEPFGKPRRAPRQPGARGLSFMRYKGVLRRALNVLWQA